MLIGVFVLAVGIFAYTRFFGSDDGPNPDTGTYYKGPMKAKSTPPGTADSYGTEDGRAMAAPEGPAPIAQGSGGSALTSGSD